MLIEFYLAVGVMCLLMAVLALLMAIADATIANYGDVTITINGAKKIRARGGRSLLNTLKDEKVFIPSACGGRGSCGLCKVKLESGEGEPLQTEIPWLSPEEVAGRVRLSCQLKVKHDLAIRVRDEILSVSQFTSKVVSLRNLTPDIKEVVLDLQDPPAISFRAGQFIQIEVPPYALTDEPVYRAYSIASDPQETGRIQLMIRYVPNGICTTYVHRHLKIGDTVTFNGPYGEFYLRDTNRKILFIAGGSGMAPIQSILLDMARRRCTRPAVYFFGARSREDLFALDTMRQVEQDLPSFRFIPTLSRPKPEDRWEGEIGLVTAVVDRLVESVDNTEAYLCGSPLMIDAVIRILQNKGLPPDLIYFDKFA